MRSLTVSYCTFSAQLCLCLSLCEANEHGTYPRAPTRSSKHAAALSHTLMCSESYPCCYGCQQYLKKDGGSYLSLSLELRELERMGAGGHQVAKTETATFGGVRGPGGRRRPHFSSVSANRKK